MNSYMRKRQSPNPLVHSPKGNCLTKSREKEIKGLCGGPGPGTGFGMYLPKTKVEEKCIQG